MQNLRNNSVAILGIPVNNITMSDALQAIENSIEEGGFHQIATANVDFLINSIHDAELKEILAACYLVLPDGMPLLWAANMMHVPLRERVTGADLVPRLIELSSRRGYRIFLLGASETASRGAVEWIEKRHPQASVVGRYCPPVAELEGMDHQDILMQIDAAQPDILLVAFGSPKQEKWLAMHRHRLRVPVCIGVGGSLDLLAGLVPRAPLYMQNHGLEWFYRACHEPLRLSRRYLKDAWGLVRYMTFQLAATAAQQKRIPLNRLAEERVGTTTVLRVTGSFTGVPVAGFEEDTSTAVEEGHNIVLDFAGMGYLGADGLGTLLHLANLAKDHHQELWLTGLRASHARVLHASLVDTCFRIAPKVTDALRRLDPWEFQMSVQAGGDWADLRIGGRKIPLRGEAAMGLRQQAMRMVDEAPIPGLAKGAAVAALAIPA